jgi:hypothetical protein
MSINVRFRELVTRELADADRPPIGSLAADALREGERARRRRRAGLFGVTSTAVAVLAVLVALGVPVGPGPSRSGSPVMPGAAASPGLTGGPTSSAAAPTTGAVMPTGPTKPVTGQAVIVLLTELLPPGGTRTEIEGNTDPHGAGGGFVYDDGQGRATVSAGVTDAPQSYGDPLGMQCPPNGAGFTCENRIVEGFVVRILTMGPYGADCSELKCGIKDVRVEVARPLGVYVTVESFNGPFGQGRAATRSDTLLSVDQMVAMATDPRWGLRMDASFVDTAQTQVDPTAVFTPPASSI